MDAIKRHSTIVIQNVSVFMKARFENNMVGNTVIVGNRKICMCAKSTSTVTEDLKPLIFSFLQRVKCKRLEISSWLLGTKEPNEKANWDMVLGKLTIINCTEWMAIPILTITIKPPYDKTPITVRCMEKSPTCIPRSLTVLRLWHWVSVLLNYKAGPFWGRYCIGCYKLPRNWVKMYPPNNHIVQLKHHRLSPERTLKMANQK